MPHLQASTPERPGSKGGWFGTRAGQEQRQDVQHVQALCARTPHCEIGVAQRCPALPSMRHTLPPSLPLPLPASLAGVVAPQAVHNDRNNARALWGDGWISAKGGRQVRRQTGAKQTAAPASTFAPGAHNPQPMHTPALGSRWT